MQKQNPTIVFTRKESEKFHNELLRAEARIRKNIFHARKQRGFTEFGKFGLTTVLIFVIAFGSMNASAFLKRAEFLLSNVQNSEAEVNTEITKIQSQKINITNSAIKENGENKFELPPALEEISPPDNRLIIPRLGIHAPIQKPDNVNLRLENWDEIEKQIQNSLRDGVVNFPGTANPGEKGNAFITGHSSYYPLLPGKYKDIFALLPEIEIGEEIQVWQNQQKFIYRVSEKKEVSPSETSVLNNSDDSRLTLMTCTPLGTALRRLIVTSHLVN
jgi:LPXTG-site transpeptidase (sortase) family protein